MSEFILRKATEISDYRQAAETLVRGGWAEFILQDPIAAGAWDDIYRFFRDYAFFLCEKISGTPAAVGLTAPLAWDGEPAALPEEGWHWVLRQTAEDYRAKKEPKTLAAVAAVVHPDFRGQALAPRLVAEMKNVAVEHGFRRVIAPLRPSLKCRYPLTPMERYAAWKREDGQPFDPWLRVHAALGASVVGVCRRSITIEADVADWEKWTGLAFPEPGEYVIPRGDATLAVDGLTGRGMYVAPGIWVVHEV